MAVVCHEAVFLNVVFRRGLHTCSHTRQILNWEIQTPHQFLSSPKAIFMLRYCSCSRTLAKPSRCGVDVAGRHSGSVLLCSRTVTLWMASAVVQIVRPRAGHRIAGLWKLLYSSPSSILLLPCLQMYCVRGNTIDPFRGQFLLLEMHQWVAVVCFHGGSRCFSAFIRSATHTRVVAASNNIISANDVWKTCDFTFLTKLNRTPSRQQGSVSVRSCLNIGWEGGVNDTRIVIPVINNHTHV